MRLKDTLSHEVHVTQTSRGVTKTTRSTCRAHRCSLRVSWFRVLVVDVVCVMLVVLIAHVDIRAVSTQFT